MNKHTPLLTARHLTKYYYKSRRWFRRSSISTKAIDGISFSLSANKITGLIGESGSGKTTLAFALAGLLPLTSGSITFKQRALDISDKQDLRFLRSQVRMVFQHPKDSLNPRKTIFDSLGGPLLYHRLVNKNDVIDHVVAMLRLVGLSEDYLYHYPHQLSGGQQQRVSIARALQSSPQLILCDEIVSALDVSMQAQILNMLASIQQQYKHSFLFISHDLSVVRAFCSELIIMYQGKIVETGDTETIFRNPQHPYTQMLLDAQLPSSPRARKSLQLA